MPRILPVVLATVVLFAEPRPLVAQRNAEVSRHLNEIIAVLREDWLFRDTADWNELQASLLERARSAGTVEEATPAIRDLLEQLGDRHTWYRTPEGEMFFNPRSPTQVTGECTPEPFSTPPVPPGIGYIRIQITPQTPPSVIHASLRNGQNEGVKRWIVDLRNSRGGNMWPALLGLGPLLGDGVAGYFVGPEGSLPWGYRQGRVWLASDTILVTDDPLIGSMEDAAIAVLTDIGVASSGEAIAVALRGRRNTRSFGIGTCGLSTAVRGIPLSNGAILGVVSGVMADRHGNEYGRRVLPDEVVTSPEAAFHAAVAWLLRQ